MYWRGMAGGKAALRFRATVPTARDMRRSPDGYRPAALASNTSFVV
jgi:hypothetical protein